MESGLSLEEKEGKKRENKENGWNTFGDNRMIYLQGWAIHYLEQPIF
jgi:hypothetical protein